MLIQYPCRNTAVADYIIMEEPKFFNVRIDYTPLNPNTTMQDIVGTADMIHAFNKTCPELLKLTARQVAQRLVDEVNVRFIFKISVVIIYSNASLPAQVAELMHTFGASTNNQARSMLCVAAWPLHCYLC